MKRHPVSYLRDILENRRDPQEFVSGFSPQQFSDAAFCELCQHIQRWVAQENRSRRPENRISRDAVGLRSSEDYDDPAEGPRIATIYNGLCGHAQFVPFRKGDPEGSRWVDNEPLYCDWTKVPLTGCPQVHWPGGKDIPSFSGRV